MMTKEEDVTCPLHHTFSDRIDKMEECVETIKSRFTGILVVIVIGIVGFFAAQVFFHVNQSNSMDQKHIAAIVLETMKQVKK